MSMLGNSAELWVLPVKTAMHKGIPQDLYLKMWTQKMKGLVSFLLLEGMSFWGLRCKLFLPL